MKSMRILGLALVAVFALVAISAASASAAPTWNECAKAPVKNTGGFTDKACTTPSPGKEGKYNLQPGVGKGKAFKTSGGKATLFVVVPATGKGKFPGGATVEVKCASAKGSGKAAMPNKVEKVITEFKGCEAVTAPCQSGTKKGVIKTNALSGELNDIEGGSGVAIELGPETGTALATFTCTGVATTNVLGSVMAEQTEDVGTISKTATDNFIVGPGLGEVEYAPGHKYTPLVNIPTHKTGGPNGEHFLLSEITEAGEEHPAGTLPSGQELAAKNKGEALEVLP